MMYITIQLNQIQFEYNMYVIYKKFYNIYKFNTMSTLCLRIFLYETCQVTS